MPFPAWSDFFAAQLGASAALTGLLFVGISINMPRILSIPVLPDRALEALALLTTLLLASTLYLVPGLAARELGVGIAVLGFGAWAYVSRLSRRVLRATPPPFRRGRLFEVGLIQLALLSWTATGVGLTLLGPDATDLVIPAVLATFLTVAQISWVLLIEINR